MRTEKVGLGLKRRGTHNAAVKLRMKSQVRQKVKLEVTEDDLMGKSAQGRKRR
jgi:hypothetical protein